MIVVERDGQRRTLELTPVWDAKGEPPRPRLGFGYGVDNKPGSRSPGPPSASPLDRFWFVTRETVTLPEKLIRP